MQLYYMFNWLATHKQQQQPPNENEHISAITWLAIWLYCVDIFPLTPLCYIQGRNVKRAVNSHKTYYIYYKKDAENIIHIHIYVGYLLQTFSALFSHYFLHFIVVGLVVYRGQYIFIVYTKRPSVHLISAGTNSIKKCSDCIWQSVLFHLCWWIRWTYLMVKK